MDKTRVGNLQNWSAEINYEKENEKGHWGVVELRSKVDEENTKLG